MSKHKIDKYSQMMKKQNNKAGDSPQAPKTKMNSRNQYK